MQLQAKQKAPVDRPAQSGAQQRRELLACAIQFFVHVGVRLHFTTPTPALHTRPRSIAMVMRNEGAL